MSAEQQIQDAQIDASSLAQSAWENHILEFFIAKLPGNESNFNFTEILANFPYQSILEQVIQNRPAKPVEIYFDFRFGNITKKNIF
jgi:hypothetical protein